MKNCKILSFLSVICFFFSSKAQDNISVMDFFNQINGQSTVLAIHNREPNSDPAKQTNEIIKRTGKTPAMWSGDFLFSSSDVSNRQTMIDECKRQWDNGAIVQLMLHVVSPKNNGEAGDWNNDYGSATGVCSKLTDAEWTDLITNGGTLNTKWKQRLDIYAGYLQQLKDHGATVLFRPFHEMNQAMFWWAGRPGDGGTRKLYDLTRDYLVNTKGLTNIIWIWNMQDIWNYSTNSFDWGEAYKPTNFDIFSVDIYDNSSGFSDYKYQQALNAAGNKPIAIGECEVLPTPQKLLQQPKWVFCMSWAELTFKNNSDQEIQNLYSAANTLTLDKLPKFSGPSVSKPLDVPTGLYLSDATEQYGSPVVEFRWDLVEGAAYYNIFKLEAGTGESFVYIGTLHVKDDVEFDCYYDENVEPGKTYSYKVLAGKGDEQSEYSQAVSITLPSFDNGGTPIRWKKNYKRYDCGILLEEPLVCQTAKIKVITAEKSKINLAIYDNVANKVFETTGKSSETFIWNLTNLAGKNVTNGSYFVIAEVKGVSGKVYAYSAKVGVRR